MVQIGQGIVQKLLLTEWLNVCFIPIGPIDCNQLESIGNDSKYKNNVKIHDFRRFHGHVNSLSNTRWRNPKKSEETVQKHAISRWYRNWVTNDCADKCLRLWGETVEKEGTVTIPNKVNHFYKYHHSRNYGIFAMVMSNEMFTVCWILYLSITQRFHKCS